MSTIKSFLLCMSAVGLFSTSTTLFASNTSSTNNLWNPYNGRLLLSGTGSNVIIGGLDGMLPIYGNQNGFLFADTMGNYASDNTWLASPGVGFRDDIHNRIIGLNFFGDYQRTNQHENFWDVSPGVEWISPHWDAHANLYFPVDSSVQTGAPVFLSSMGNYSRVSFQPGTHNQLDALVAPFAVIGNGVDAELGFSFSSMKNLRARVFLGGYYYWPSNVTNITGVTAGFDEPLNKYVSVKIQNSYDQVTKDTLACAINFTLGGNSNIFTNDVHDRLLDPIDHHIGIIGTGAGTYAQQTNKNVGTGLEYNNVYFLSSGNSFLSAVKGASDIGAYGTPAPLTQATLDAINSLSPNGARIYIQGGSSAIYTVNATTAGANNGLQLYNGQDLYGRSFNYTESASAGQQPIISVDGADGFNGFIVNSGENTFSNLAITSSSTNGNTFGIDAITNTNATVNVINTSITALNSGLYAGNNGTGTLTINAINSSFNGNTNSGDSGNSGANGISALNGSGNLIINTNNSQFNGNTNNGDASLGAYGIYASNGSGNVTINATNSTFNNNMNNGLSGGAAGIRAVNTSTGALNINAINSQFNTNIGIGDANGGAYGIWALDGGSLSSYQNLNLINSSFNGNADNGETNGGAYGVYLQASNLNLNVTNSTFNGNINTNNTGNSTWGAGMLIFDENSGVINISNSQFNGNMNSGNDNTNAGADGLIIAALGNNDFTLNVAGSQFNNNVVSGVNNAGAYGLQVFNEGTGAFIMSATNSQFNGNSANGVNNPGGYGFFAENDGVGPLSVTSLSGSTFNNNSTYGIYGIGNPLASTSVNFSGATFFGNLINVGNGGDVVFAE